MKQLFLPSAAGLAGIMGLVFAIFSFYTISSSKNGKSKCMCFLLVLSISVLVSGMIVVRYQGRPEAVAALYAAHAVHMVLYCLMLGAFVAYLRRALGLQPRQWRWQSICIYIALALLVLLGATNALHRQILTISPQTGLETPQSLYPPVSVSVCLIFGMCLYKVVVQRKRPWQSGVALGFFCVSHILVVLMQLYLGGGSGADLTSLFAILVLYASFYFEENQKYAQQEQELQNARAALVLSQIQPHFLFNSLAVVMDLCDTEPKEAKAALQELSDYLHYKMAALSSCYLVSFAEDMEFLHNYLKLEKRRFGPRLTVEYDIRVRDFQIPLLTLQPLAENAIRHGIRKRPQGGTLRVSTREVAEYYSILVEDNGVGFDPSRPPDGSRKHVGLENVRTRLAILCGGTMTVRSAPGVGTTVEITIRKEEETPHEHTGHR